MSASWLEVDTGAIEANLRLLTSRYGPATQVLAVVKANGYGHGLVQAGGAAVAGGAAMLGVARVEEGIALREAGLTIPILVMGLCLPDQAPEVARHRLDAVVSVTELTDALSRAAAEQGTTLRVHLKVDTGMLRVGVPLGKVAREARRIRELPGLSLVALCSHFASAGDDPESVREQSDAFEAALAELESVGVTGLRCHVAASAAAARHPETRRHLVRLGLLTYGVPAYPGADPGGLRPALRWLARLTQVRPAPQGGCVSYGRTHRLRRDSVLGLVPVGFADGWPRSLSNRGFVLVRGHRAPVLGRVCMDQCVVDLTDVPSARVGDEVVLIGQSGDLTQTVDDVAAQAGTIAHEILSRLGSRLPRVYTRS